MTPAFQKSAEMLKRHLRAKCPNDLSNDIPPFTTGIEQPLFSSTRGVREKCSPSAI
jgi:hypothetical protein